MDDNVGAFYISNGAVRSAGTPMHVDVLESRVVYEVIRIIDGVPLFFEDHYARMENSFITIGGVLKLDAGTLKAGMKSLLEANGYGGCNVKITVYERRGEQEYLMYISKSYYPGPEEISKGVATGLLRLERQNPNAKVLNQSYKEAVAESIRKGGYFEVLLVNRDDGITEGSKSNVFFFKEGRIFTAPGSEVLRGVTRKYVLEACRAAGYEVVEALVRTDGLEEVEGLFLSGTSIKVLPVSEIEGRKFASASHPAILSVRNEYDALVKKYIDAHVNIW
jgi:branched-chain amino acid aminotransferase